MRFQGFSPWFVGTFEKRLSHGSDQEYGGNDSPTRRRRAVLITVSTAQGSWTDPGSPPRVGVRAAESGPVCRQRRHRSLRYSPISFDAGSSERLLSLAMRRVFFLKVEPSLFSHEELGVGGRGN